MSTQKTGIELIRAERARQVEALNYTKVHDAQYKNEELARAASCYATPQSERTYGANMIPMEWPFAHKYWKPTPGDRVRELVKAGALFMAADEQNEEAKHTQQIEDIAAKIDELQNQQVGNV